MKQLKRKRAAPLATTDVDSGVTVNAVAGAVGESSASARSPTTATSAATRRFAMPASCTVRDSVALHAALKEIATATEPVVLDMAAIERIDTAAMQILCAFVRDRKAVGSAVEFVGSAEPFCEAVRLLGLQQVLGLAQTQLAGNELGEVAT